MKTAKQNFIVWDSNQQNHKPILYCQPLHSITSPQKVNRAIKQIWTTCFLVVYVVHALYSWQSAEQIFIVL